MRYITFTFFRWMPIDGCIELTGGVPERVRNLPMFLSEEQAHSGTHASDRLFFDLIRASQMGNIILVSLPSSSSLKPEEGQPPNRRTPEQAALKVAIQIRDLNMLNQKFLCPKYQ